MQSEEQKEAWLFALSARSGSEVAEFRSRVFSIEASVASLSAFGIPRFQPGSTRPSHPAAPVEELTILGSIVSLEFIRDEATRLPTIRGAHGRVQSDLDRLIAVANDQSKIGRALLDVRDTATRQAWTESLKRELFAQSFFRPWRAFATSLHAAHLSETVRSALEVQAGLPSAVMLRAVFEVFARTRLLLHEIRKLHRADEASPRIHPLLVLARRDLHELGEFLKMEAGDELTRAFEHAAIRWTEKRTELAVIAAQVRRLHWACLYCGTWLGEETARVFERIVPTSIEARQPAFVAYAIAELGSCIRQLESALYFAIDPEDVLPRETIDENEQRNDIERLRREVWIGRAVNVAFSRKASASEGPDPFSWSRENDCQFVRDFVVHFRALGFGWLRALGVEAARPLLKEIEHIENVDLLSAEAVRELAKATQKASDDLARAFEDVSRRREVLGQPFDKKTATLVLRSYLGAS